VGGVGPPRRIVRLITGAELVIDGGVTTQYEEIIPASD
jgi:hypothetical protein